MHKVTDSIQLDDYTKLIMKGGDALPHCIVLDLDRILLAMYLAFKGGNI